MDGLLTMIGLVVCGLFIREGLGVIADALRR